MFNCATVITLAHHLKVNEVEACANLGRLRDITGRGLEHLSCHQQRQAFVNRLVVTSIPLDSSNSPNQILYLTQRCPALARPTRRLIESHTNSLAQSSSSLYALYSDSAW